MRNRVLACLKCMENRLYSFKKMCFDTASENIHFQNKIQTMKKEKKFKKKGDKGRRIPLKYSMWLGRSSLK